MTIFRIFGNRLNYFYIKIVVKKVVVSCKDLTNFIATFLLKILQFLQATRLIGVGHMRPASRQFGPLP